jgi:hypothetical protein
MMLARQWQTLRSEGLKILRVPGPFNPWRGGTVLIFSSDIHSFVPLPSTFPSAMLNAEDCQMTGASRPVRGPRHSTAFLIETQVRIEIAATHRKQRKATKSNRNFFRGSGKSEERSFRLRPAPAKLRRGRKIARGFAPLGFARGRQDDGVESKAGEKTPAG